MKIPKSLLLIILLLVAATVTDCTVQKRNYRKGYYVSFKKNPLPVKLNNERTHSSMQLAKNVEFVAPSKSAPVLQQTEVALAVLKNKKFGTHKPKIKPLFMLTDSCGDVLVMRDGLEITAKVTEVGSKTIKYKRCDNLNGPTIVVSTDRVFMIKYASGTKEIFKERDPDETALLDNQPLNQIKPVVHEAKKMNGFALSSFLVSLLSWTLVLAPISLIFGFIGLSQTTNNPQKYYGRGLAVAGVIITLAVLFIFFLAIL